MRVQRAAVVAGVVLLIGIAPQARADVITEGVTTARCTENEDMRVPKRLVLTHMVESGDFSASGQVALILTGGHYGTGIPKSEGKITATAKLIKPDDTVISLGKIKAKIIDGEFERVKIVDAVVETGDRVRWKIKNKGMARLLADSEDCWEVELLLGIADEISQ